MAAAPPAIPPPSNAAASPGLMVNMSEGGGASSGGGSDRALSGAVSTTVNPLVVSAGSSVTRPGRGELGSVVATAAVSGVGVRSGWSSVSQSESVLLVPAEAGARPDGADGSASAQPLI